MCSYDVSHLLQRKTRLIFKFSSVFCTSGCIGLFLVVLHLKARCFIQGVLQWWSRYQEGFRIPTPEGFQHLLLAINLLARGKWDQAISFYPFQKRHPCFCGAFAPFPGLSSVVLWASAALKQSCRLTVTSGTLEIPSGVWMC